MSDLAHVFTSLGALVFARGEDGQFSPCNAPPAWCHELGREDLQPGQALALEELFPFLTSFLPEAQRVWSDPAAGVLSSDFWVETGAAGEELHLKARAVRSNGRGVLVIVRDESSYREQQLRLQKARDLRMTHDALMRELERKDILLHAIVHDLAAPLHSIVGSLSLLHEAKLPAPEARWITIAIDAAARQRELVDSILDVFIADHDAPTDTSPRAALQRAVERALLEREPVANRSRVALRVHGVAPVDVIAEDTRLVRVLTNLLDNALRHAPAGSAVEVEITREETSVCIAVEDRGPGLSPEHLPRLFHQLSRVPGDPTSHGLGLYFCRITVERWGGGIGYEPREGGGARFWIRLRVAAPDRRGEG
ncbi:MAG TPA: HAMP domain-containing sensor histidine kinase [Kofleriaceae bacterium]|nr:HAMP domain-containing sensor histidine kinase [Kofleriaceae bacterium]